MATTAAATKPTYTVAQQAWLNFVAKVRRGEQVDPTGQYVKDGTIMPDDAKSRTRPKLSADRDKYPFRLLPDGTVVMLKTASRDGGETNVPFPTEDPPVECPPGGCTGVPTGPTTTTTFVTSEGLGGSGDIVDIKIIFGNPAAPLPYYEALNADLNKGAGGAYIYYQFTRDGANVEKGKEYNYPSTLNSYDPIVAYVSGTGIRSTPPYDFNIIWRSSSQLNYYWDRVDLNAGAGGEYIYSYQSKSLGISNSASFHEIGILSGNSDQIQPPSGWIKAPNDLNEGAGGDYIYFCYKQ